ncbi:Na+ dependent nucleoside transporter C-terminus-domain-containing protein [Paraphysoderma sedebokerense]|nr:Na+ dependent nucleoside transporter C-terminus-domain-containing protein [Paraphysoderma sedebokerense]
MGIFLQFIIGLFIIRTQIGKELFTFVSKGVASFLGLSKKGAAFIFTPDIIGTKMFATSVLPAIVFFAAFIQMVYWLGAMQWIIVKFAWLMVRLMDTSGSESVVAAASPFVGQGESALLVLPFLQYMTQSEIHSAMTSGFSTIAGSVLVAFEDFGVNTTYLITACIMSVPCSLALSKLRVPETEDSITKGQVSIPKEENREENILHAACNGAAQGMTLIALIVGSLLAIISLYHLANNILIWLCGFLNPASPITIELILGYVFYPFAWLIGVPLEDCRFVGQLMGTKMVVNEFVAYLNLADNYKNMTPRGITLATYGLCGFANIASVGIQIGCLGAMAPSRKADIAKLALSAMLTGTLCTFTSAAIAGIML